LIVEPNDIQVMNDKKNQSNLHAELSHRAIRWINNKATQRGLRTGVEIWIDKKYTVDGLAIGDWQLRYDEYYGSNIKRVDDLVFIFEAKVSRPDFLKTFKENGNSHDNRLSPIGNFHWIIAPMGLLSPEEIPTFWGLLEAKGRSVFETKKPIYQTISLERLHAIGYWLLRQLYKYGYPENLERLKCPECTGEKL